MLRAAHERIREQDAEIASLRQGFSVSWSSESLQLLQFDEGSAVAQVQQMNQHLLVRALELAQCASIAFFDVVFDVPGSDNVLPLCTPYYYVLCTSLEGALSFKIGPWRR